LSTPLHPLIVHFPIVMLLLGAAAQIVSLWKPDFFDKAASWLFAGGFISGVVSYLTGDGAEDYAREHLNPSHDAIELHEHLALASLVVFGLIIAIKLLRHFRPNIRLLTGVLIVLSVAGAALIAATGHYGGQLVYAR
jgi:uncharacterized membrane protein